MTNYPSKEDIVNEKKEGIKHHLFPENTVFEQPPYDQREKQKYDEKRKQMIEVVENHAIDWAHQAQQNRLKMAETLDNPDDVKDIKREEMDRFGKRSPNYLKKVETINSDKK